MSATKVFLLRCAKGKAWEDIVEAWYQFETMGFDKDSRITEVSARPHELKRWLQAQKAHMPGAFAPILEDVEDYKMRWMRWWWDLKTPVGGGEDHEVAIRAIRRAGPSGVVTVLLGLAFWTPGMAKSVEWKEVVKELQGFLKSSQ